MIAGRQPAISTTRLSGSDAIRRPIVASMDDPGWVVVLETAWKGWRVLRSHELFEVHFADHAFIGFHVPRGEHDLVMQ